MAFPQYRNLNLMHSNVQIGEVLPYWTDQKSGKIYKTKVDDYGLYCVAKIRNDIDIAKRVRGEMERGNLISFSISGTAKDKQSTWENGRFVELIKDLEIVEITACLEGINHLAKFSILQKQVANNKEEKKKLLSEIQAFTKKALLRELKKDLERLRGRN